MFRRWQITHYELQRLHDGEAGERARTMLGAYGLTSSGARAVPHRHR